MKAATQPGCDVQLNSKTMKMLFKPSPNRASSQNKLHGERQCRLDDSSGESLEVKTTVNCLDRETNLHVEVKGNSAGIQELNSVLEVMSNWQITRGEESFLS